MPASRTLVGSLFLFLGVFSMSEVSAQSSITEQQDSPVSKSSPQAEASSTSVPPLAEMLSTSWRAYADKFITANGRVVDLSSPEGITTSEGQSYAMLRAVWLDDKQTFESVWSWTTKNLKRPNDHLFSWKWGKRADSSEGVLSDQAATDADQDIALALLLAAKKWERPELKAQALEIMNDIWRLEVVTIKDTPYLTAGDWAPKLANPRLNPSYFAPYIYRVFDSVETDKTHKWLELVSSGYDVLKRSCELSLVKLPPDWCTIDSTTAEIYTEPQDKASDYSYDAMRTPWRIALDWQLNNEPRAKEALEKMIFLRENWRVNHKLQASYTAYGVIRSFVEPLATFGCALPMFSILKPDMAREILQERVYPVYKDGLFEPVNDYYNNNWIWFGLASYAGAIKL